MFSVRASSGLVRLLGLAIVILAVLALVAGARQPNHVLADSPVQVPIQHLRHSTSSNWSGYAELTSLSSPKTGAVSAVSGTWTVPAVDCTVTPTGYSSTWVGIDGYSSSTVEQLGTEQDCSSGTPGYYAWYEMYPRYPYYIPYAVSPGDSITASVQFSGWYSFKLSMHNATKGWTFTTTQYLFNAARSSAEWVEEAPSSGGTLPLADFQTVNFSNASATINGVTSAINTFADDPITMVDGSAKATPSALSANGTAFSVAFSTASAPPPPPTTATMKVSSIRYSYYSWGYWGGVLYVTVTVENSSGQALPGAAVSMALTDTSTSTTWHASGVTGSNGSVSFSLWRPPAGTYKTTITSVTANGLTWDGVTPANSYVVP